MWICEWERRPRQQKNCNTLFFIYKLHNGRAIDFIIVATVAVAAMAVTAIMMTMFIRRAMHVPVSVATVNVNDDSNNCIQNAAKSFPTYTKK